MDNGKKVHTKVQVPEENATFIPHLRSNFASIEK